MKKSTLFLMIPLSFVVTTFFTSCNKNDEIPVQRDVSIEANFTGSLSQSMNFLLPEGKKSAAGENVSSSLTSSELYLIVTVNNGSYNLNLNISANTSSVSETMYTLHAGNYWQLSPGNAVNYRFTAGTLTVTSAESTLPFGTEDSRYISGTYEVDLFTTSSGDMPQNIPLHISGTFTNVFVQKADF